MHAGMKDRPHNTAGTMNEDVLAHGEPNYHRTNVVGLIRTNTLPS
jgi:hypothetical protein